MEEPKPQSKESFMDRFLQGQSSNIKKAFDIGMKIGWFVRLFFFILTLNIAIQEKTEGWVLGAVLLGASLIPQAYSWCKEMVVRRGIKK